MTPAEYARIHAAAFTQERPWRADEFSDLLTQPHTEAFNAKGGFALTRTVAGETELLTLAVDPTHQRKGIARALVSTWLSKAAAQAETAFLEVSADNAAALALYDSLAFTCSGLRKSYYKHADGSATDAIVMTRTILRR